MKKQNQHTAIFIFARSEKVEARKKILTRKGKNINQALIRQMNLVTERIALSTGLPVLWINGNTTHNDSFGEKIQKAFRQVFEAGYQNVIGIGNDCPALNRQTLLHTAQQLQNHHFVIGPAKDGGIYLMGFRKEAFEKLAFIDLPWCTNRLCDAFMDKVKKFDSLVLPVENDLDSPTDLVKLKLSNLSGQFVERILSVLNQTTCKVFRSTQTFFHSYLPDSHLLRAPPRSVI